MSQLQGGTRTMSLALRPVFFPLHSAGCRHAPGPWPYLCLSLFSDAAALQIQSSLESQEPAGYEYYTRLYKRLEMCPQRVLYVAVRTGHRLGIATSGWMHTALDTTCSRIHRHKDLRLWKP